MKANEILDNAIKSNAWPFIEANKILDRINHKTPEKGYVLFETGYGPSGLPHIGTFGEVARTLMVKHAFETISDIPTKLLVISDDIDGIRKVPDNIPNEEMIRANIDKPTTAVPDPFGTHASYGDHMNARLKKFLDHFGFEYEFKSSTECYKAGVFNKGLLGVLKEYDKIMSLMLPTLGEERQKTYSPFLPICPRTGKVLQVKITNTNIEQGTINYNDPETGEEVEIPVTDGHCKLQWKPDFGMRWFVFDVDFEMYGKDHQANGPLYSRICEIIGGKAPHQFVYELFLDDKGQKISKSKGNGITIDEWLTYAPTESLALYMFNSPRKAKRLYFDVIPKNVDDYMTFINKYDGQDEIQKLQNPVWHIHEGNPPKPEVSGLTFSLLLNLASACNPEDKSVMWGFISKYDKHANPENSPFLDRLVAYAIQYYNDFVKPHKSFKTPDQKDKDLLENLKAELAKCEENMIAEDIQKIIYAIGRDSGMEMRDYFQNLYKLLLGQDQGPRFGSFIALYGVKNTINLIDKVLS